ncbi:MAG: flagellar hook-associated protein FlgK [Rubrivivax sp.]
MGASPLMSLGMRAMAANYAALQVTGHNIANANVEGYSRQRVELATAQAQFSGAGFFGKGSDVETVVRAHDAFLTREALTTQSLAAMDAARLGQLQRLENVFPTGENGLGAATLKFLDAMSDLASNPADASARQVVLARAQELSARFAGAGAQLDSQQQLLREDLKTTVSQVNEITRSIASVNQQIAAVRGLGQPPNDLLDQRDLLIAKLSEQISVTTVKADDGSIGVFAGGGQRLVLGTQALALAVVDDPEDPSRAAIAVLDNGTSLRLNPDTLGGGRLPGLLKFQNDDLVDARALLGQMAAAVAGAVNAQQQRGLNLRPPVGSVPSQNLFSVGAPVALPNAGNQKDASGRFVAQVGLSVVSPSELQASEYRLAADPSGTPGAWQLTRLADGRVTTLADGDVVDGLRISVGSPAPATTDRFLLQPVSRAAVDMRALLTDPRDLAAASPLTASAAAANTGTAAIASLTITDPSVNPQQVATLSFTDDAGAYAWELRDRTSNALVSSGTGTWQAGQSIPAAPDPAINGFALTLSGVPRSGDVLTVEPTPYPASNNGNARALAALRDAVLVGRVRLSDGSLAGGGSVTDAYASAMADIGVRVQGAASMASISGAMAAAAETARSNDAGVNLDEEAARLIEFQQSYQAAAKVLQIAQQIFDTLLQATSR